MKKLLILLISVFLVSCGTAEQDEVEQTEDTQAVTATSTTSEEATDEVEDEEEGQEEQEEKVIPTERTVETQGNYPWQYFSLDLIEEMQLEGETVFLLDDAEGLEDAVIQTANMETDDNEIMIENKEDNAEAMPKHIDFYLNEVEKFIDNKEYIEKLNEIQQASLNYDYDLMITLAEEAKQIRESE